MIGASTVEIVKSYEENKQGFVAFNRIVNFLMFGKTYETDVCYSYQVE